MIFVKRTQSTTRPDPTRPHPTQPGPNNDGDNDETESGRGGRGRGGAVNRGDGNGGSVFSRAFAAFRTTSPKQFPVSSFFPRKSFAWHPPEIKREFAAPTKAP